ncbi:hypothetical protein T11_8017 [Trichinella zimbabwensis]|uniref:Uncharacterized protein n=1 Tax=Trichinella zimbabwensis TaxID=268475 RepID=A0A0V1DQW5_9BILA|nr:hypothetical protein T11_8017 [Trichinella zimbabwensis]
MDKLAFRKKTAEPPFPPAIFPEAKSFPQSFLTQV